MDYEVRSNRQIILTEKAEERVMTKTSQQQQTITGVVTDAGGLSLPGVTVVVKGTSTGTVTNNDGEFSLDLPSGADTLQFSFVGMRTQQVPIDGRTTFTVVMEEESIGLDEVVAIGYGRRKKLNLTGAVGVINSDEIAIRTVNSTTQALQGLSPNLNIDVNTSGGESDASMNINIRGTGSLSTSNPYILINGVRATQSELAALNPMDIQDISVLKDAASTAIYGAQAAYGVILITTKQGIHNQDFEMNYSSSLRQKQRIFVPKPYGGSQKYAEVKNIASYNSTGQYHFSSEHLEKIRAYAEGEIPHQTEQDPRNPNYWLGIGAGGAADWSFGYANTDWFDVMYKDKEYAQKHDISVRGGSDKITYHISGGYLNDQGALKFGEEEYKKYNFNSNIRIDITDWLNFSNNTRYYYENNIFPTTLDAGNVNEDRGRIYHDIIRFQPLAPWKTPPVKDEEGNIIVPEQLAQIPAIVENNGFNEYNKNNLVTIFKAEINIVKNLNLLGDFSFKKNFYDRTMNLKKWTFFGPDGKPNITYQANNNQIQKDNRKTDYTSFNIYVDYRQNVLENHNFEILAGYQQEEEYFNRLQVSRQNVLANELNSTEVAVGEVIGPDNPISTWSTMGFFGRLNYNFREKYLIEFNGRYDGSSKFEKGNRFGFFPSLSAGYNIDKEDFWSPLSNIINTFKLRASIGKLGNQDVAGYLYMSSIPVSSRLSWIIDDERPAYTSMPGIVSPDITWETSFTKNLGIDFSMFDGRLSTEFDIYKRETDNMFGPSSTLPSVLGANPPQTNSASLETKGWELVIGWKDLISNKFNYYAKFMLSDNTSTITRYNNPNKVLNTWYEGKKIGEIWGYESDGLFQSVNEVEEYLSEVDLSH
ncbi:MAG: SusC/RagA family TonB-linked outer membrane protein, partial [Bacteroidota bacterium]